MGCLVEKTDTGVEIDVHVFDDCATATDYVIRARGYTFDRHDTWAFSPGFDFYRGPVEGERASVRHLRGAWRAVFWIEGNAKVERAGAFESKPTWHGLYRVQGGDWVRVCNSDAKPIAYASADAALAGAKVMLGEVQRNTVKG